MGAAKPRQGPGSLVRLVGRTINYAVARWPASWVLLRAPTKTFFDKVARGWDERVQSGSEEFLAPLVAALDRVTSQPGRILDIGTGTGAAAFELAARFPHSRIVGIDISEEMIAQTRVKATRHANVRFLVADIAHFDPDESFDLITMLNMPPFFARVAALLKPGGAVINASSYGSRTPFYTSPRTLAHGFEQHGLRTIASGRAGTGTFYLAELPTA